MKLTDYFPTILAATIAAFAISPLAILTARRFKLIDFPNADGHKQHEAPTAMAGGMVLMLSTLMMVIWNHNFLSPPVQGIVLGAIVIFAFGLMDDIIGFGAPQKLFGQILATMLLIITGTQVRLFSVAPLNLALTFLWVVGLVNAFNFVDSMDGLALGLAGITAAFFLLVTIESEQDELAYLCAGILGGCIGAYFHNMTPAKMFLGDSGSQLLGFLLAAIGVAYNPQSLQKISSWYVPILVMGVPIFDMALVVFSRLRRKTKVYKAARDHTYHRLTVVGLEGTRAVFAMHLMAILLGLASFIALTANPIVGNSIFAFAVLAGIALIIFFESRIPTKR